MLMNSLIITNIGLSPRDIIAFNEEPASFIESYFELSDINSRRTVTVDLLKSLSKYYNSEISQQIQNFVI